ncbi:MAG: CheR family methyltransferase [Deferrisomatales bacterium]
MDREPAFGELPEPDPEAYGQIAELVYHHTGIQLGPGKGYFVVGRLGRLCRALGCRGWGEFAERLRAAEGEVVDRFIRGVVTPETSFFRDEVPFRALRHEIVPRFLGGNGRPAPLRIWSAGCSTGQEPYSMVMSLWDLIAGGKLALSVWATDICEASLETARRGVYGPLQLGRGLDLEARAAFFEELPERETARLRPEVRGAVQFERFNLARGAPRLGGFHVVFCRNVAIYFDREGKRRLYRTLAGALAPGGCLVLGGSETLFPPVPGVETLYFERSLLYRKTGGDP